MGVAATVPGCRRAAVTTTAPNATAPNTATQNSAASGTQQPKGEKRARWTETKIIKTDKPQVATLAEFDKLKPGLSYAAAVKIIGAPGRKSLRRWRESPRKVMYLWNNADNSNMNAVFDNDKLAQKTQFGLR